MRFPLVFKRDVGASANPTLGSDGAPTDNSFLRKEVVLATPFSNINGWPMQRIVIGYGCTGAGSALPTTVWIWDEHSGLWFKSATHNLALNTLTWFDMPILSDPPQSATQGIGGSATPYVRAGALEAYVQISAAGGDAVGTYTFAVAPDLSNTP